VLAFDTHGIAVCQGRESQAAELSMPGSVERTYASPALARVYESVVPCCRQCACTGAPPTVPSQSFSWLFVKFGLQEASQLSLDVLLGGRLKESPRNCGLGGASFLLDHSAPID